MNIRKNIDYSAMFAAMVFGSGETNLQVSGVRDQI